MMFRVLFSLLLIAAVTGCSGGLTEVEIEDYDSLVKSGWDKYNQSEYDDAYELFLNANDKDKTMPEPYIGCGWTLLRQQNPYAAIVCFRDAFNFITSVSDSIDALCGYSGSYLAVGDDTNVINLFKRYPISSYDEAFPFSKHDFFIDKGDLELVQAMAFYRLGIYSSANQPDPDNATYHLNQALYTPYEYTDPQGLMEEITDYLNQSGSYYKW